MTSNFICKRRRRWGVLRPCVELLSLCLGEIKEVEVEVEPLVLGRGCRRVHHHAMPLPLPVALVFSNSTWVLWPRAGSVTDECCVLPPWMLGVGCCEQSGGGKSGGKSGAKGGKSKVKSGSKKTPTSRSMRAGLQFPVGRVSRVLRKGRYAAWAPARRSTWRR